jgi:hypothetical protein
LTGIVAFSFALRNKDLEPNPCNKKLGDIVNSIYKQNDCVTNVVAQWEIARHLQNLDVKFPLDIVNLNKDGVYLDSRMVWNQAKKVFKQNGINKVIPVAQPFIQLGYLKKIIKKDGFTVVDWPIEKIGYDNSPLNTQPWTTSAPALLFYAIKLALGGINGHKGRQDQT